MKKFLSVFLCLVMVCVFMPAMVWAESEAEFVQDIWVYDEARAEGLTWNEMNSGYPMVEGTKVYLYYCSYESGQSPAVPFEAVSADGFHFYDAEGNEVTEVPFSIEKDGEFWSVTCTGEVTENYVLHYLETSEAGTIIHGEVTLENAAGSGGEGGDGESDQTGNQYVNVKYQTEAIETIGDFVYVTSELDSEGKVNRNYTLEVTEQDAETGITTAKSEWIDNPARESGYNWLAIELKDGYYVDKILVNGVESTNWWAELDYFYALYGTEGNRLNVGDVELNALGCIASEENIAAWVTYYFDGNEDGTPLLTETYIEDFNAALDELKAVASKTVLLDTCVMYGVEVKNPDEDVTVEIVTAKVPEVTGTEAKAFSREGESVILTSEEAEVTDVRKESLQTYYGEDMEIEKILNLNVEGELEAAVEVVIPAADASKYNVVWFKDDNTPVPVATRYTENNDGVVFTAGHFSLYALVADADNSSEGGSGDGGSDSEGGSEGSSGGGGSYIPPYNPAPSAPSVPDIEDVMNAELMAEVKAAKMNADSKLVTMASGKKAVKITWVCESEFDFDGVEIFRSTKRYSGFGKKPIFTTEKDCYYNTAVKAGERYFYKVRGFKEIDGEMVYTDWSTKAWRTVK